MKNILFFIFFAFSCNIFSQDIYKDLQLYLPMNCNALDSSGFNFNTEIIGNPSCVEGKQYSALRFNGIDECISIPKDSSYRIVSEKGFSWSVWIKSSDLPKSAQPGRAETIISAASPSDAGDIYLGFGSFAKARNEVTFIVDGPGGTGASAAANKAELHWKPSTGFLDNEWYHLVGTRDYTNGEVKLFVNGIKVDSAIFPLNITAFNSPIDVSIGRFSDGASDIGSYFGGDIDEVRIYDRVITEQEILILFSARPEQLSVDTNLVNFSNIQCRVDSVIIKDILNVGPSDFIISEMELKVGKEFSLLNNKEVFLKDQDIYSLGIKFEPSEEGTFYDTLIVKNNFGVQPLIIYLEANKEVNIILPDTLKFDELVECMPNDTINATLLIYNENIEDGLEIDNFELSSNFQVSSTFNRIEMGDTLKVGITFKPSDFGKVSEIAKVNFINCDQSRTFNIQANYTQLDVGYDTNFDFLNAENGILKSENYIVKNNGTTNFEILNVSILGSNSQFSILSNPTDYERTLTPNDSVIISLAFTPEGGIVNDSLLIETTSLCGDNNYLTQIVGKGVYRADLSFEIPEIKAKIGDVVNVPINIIENANLKLSEIDSIEVEFEVNASSLIVEDATLKSQGSYLETYTKILQIDNNLNSQSLNLFKSQVVLGNSSKPEINVLNITSLDGLLKYDVNQANIEITDICQSGEISRLFMSSFWFAVGEPSPNPSNGEFSLDFELIEKGQTDILLYDYSGNLIKILYSNVTMPGKYSSQFNLGKINEGIYFINLVTPSHNVNKKIIIRK